MNRTEEQIAAESDRPRLSRPATRYDHARRGDGTYVAGEILAGPPRLLATCGPFETEGGALCCVRALRAGFSEADAAEWGRREEKVRRPDVLPTTPVFVTPTGDAEWTAFLTYKADVPEPTSVVAGRRRHPDDVEPYSERERRFDALADAAHDREQDGD